MSDIKPIPSFDGYYASSCGKIYKNNKELKTSYGGYKRRYLRVNIDSNKQYVQRLVLMAFAGLPKDGMQACHNDGNPENNNISNLRWDTPINNSRDKIIHGTSGAGETNSMAKLSDVLAEKIVKLNVFVKTKYLANAYGVSCRTIRSISTGKTRRNESLDMFYKSNISNSKMLMLGGR